MTAADLKLIIAPLIGFLGVCITLWWTGKANRIEEKRNRESEHDALIESLLGELSANIKILEPYVDAIDHWEEHLSKCSNLRSLKLDAWIVTSTFDDSTSRLGLLESEVIRKVTYCYSNLKMLLSYIESNRSFTSTSSNRYHGAAIELKAENMKSLGTQLRNCLENAVVAVTVLEKIRTRNNA
jgi:hypothetical protein